MKRLAFLFIAIATPCLAQQAPDPTITLPLSQLQAIINAEVARQAAIPAITNLNSQIPKPQPPEPKKD